MPTKKFDSIDKLLILISIVISSIGFITFIIKLIVYYDYEKSFNFFMFGVVMLICLFYLIPRLKK